MGEFKPIETQEELDSIIQSRLQRERDSVAKQYAGYLSPDEITRQYEGYMSPSEVSEKYSGYISPEEAAKKDARIAQYETDSVKTRIAAKYGIPTDMADRIKGNTEEEIERDAQTLAVYVTKRHAAPKATTEKREVDCKRAALKTLIEKMKED